MSARFDLIIFDYDGVIADSELLNNVVLSELLTETGLPTTVDQALAGYMGRSWRDIEPELSQRLGRSCAELPGEWQRRCQERAVGELEAVAGLYDFIGRRRGKRCIASSSPPSWIEMGLKRLGFEPEGLGPIFSGAVHVARGKPHPDLFLYASNAMAVAPQRCLVIEDSPAGVRGGAAAGMTVVGLCAAGHIRDGHAETLRQAGAHYVADDYGGIDQLLDG